MGRPGSAALNKMSTDFKGVAGGDPARRPQYVTVYFHCVVCNKPGSADTKKPTHFNPPKTCSADCALALVRKTAEGLIRYEIGRNNAPQLGSISQRMAKQVIVANTWREQAEIGRVRKVQIVCAHCEQESENFTSHRSSNVVSKFCSRECKASDDAGLPTGVICLSITKTAHLTFEEAQQAAVNMNVKLLSEGDAEGVTPYLCSCGKWHVGHGSKNAWYNSAKAAIASMNERTIALVQYRKGLKRRYG